MRMTTWAAPAALVAAAGAGLSENPWLGAWSLLFAAALYPFLRRAGGPKDPLEPVYAAVAYFFVGIGLRGLLVGVGYAEGRFLAPAGDDALVSAAYVMSAGALLCLYAGYYSKAARRAGRWLRSRRVEEAGRSGPGDAVFAYGCAAVGAASYAVFYSKFASVIDFAHNPASVAALSASGGSVYITMLAHFPVAGALFSAGWGRERTKKLALALNLAAVAAWFLVAGRKGLVLELFVGGVVMYHYRSMRLAARAMALLAGAVVVVSSAASYFRNFGVGDMDKWSGIFHGGGSALSAVVDPVISRSYHFDSLLVVLDRVGAAHDLRLGSTLTEVFYFFIPRALWPAKPLSFGYVFGLEFLDPLIYYKTSYATSLPGELFLNFHVPGVALGFFVLGLAMRTAYDGLAGDGSKLAALAYGILFVRFIHLVEGPIATHLIFTLSSLLPVFAYVVTGGLMGMGKKAVKGRPAPVLRARAAGAAKEAA